MGVLIGEVFIDTCWVERGVDVHVGKPPKQGHQRDIATEPIRGYVMGLWFSVRMLYVALTWD